MDSQERTYHGDELAIIAMAGRFPRAADLEVFWRNLRDGVEAITFFSDEELLAAGVQPAQLAHPQYVRARGTLDAIEWFDALFFGLAPREAEILDPQQRLFLECAWQVLEQAGYVAEPPGTRIGVYASASLSAYLLNLYYNREQLPPVDDFQIALANDKDYLPTRVAYKLNLTGPSVAVQTACSSSLVAVHLACQSLLNGDCDLALAGGASIRVPQVQGYQYQPGGIVSPDGHCRTFDARAQGTVVGSGVGVVLLKRLSDALADGDSIRTIIKGSAINNDGAVKIGFTAPSVQGQARVIAAALTMARVDPETVSYIEAHGSATPLGDPIEMAALTSVFRAGTKRIGYCAVGSVKTNIGHLDAAAGIAGLIKTALALEHRVIPPSLHFEQPNPEIDFEGSPFYVNTIAAEWPASRGSRRAGVSSFGIGGTNAHVVLEEAPPAKPPLPGRPWQLVLLAARNAAALETMTDRLADHLRQHPQQHFADVAYTLQVGRRPFEYRRMLVCRDREDAITALESRDPQRVLGGSYAGPARPVTMLFPGLGDHYVQMAAGVYRSEPVFRAHIDRCCQILKPILGRDLREVLYPDGPAPPLAEASGGAPQIDFRAMVARRSMPGQAAAGGLDQTALNQPAVFVVEYALAQLWRMWGIQPRAMLGYSLGEYVAACIAGVFSLEDALRLVARRAQLIQTLPQSAMLAVSLSEQELAPLINDQVFVAAINGPAMGVLAGTLEAIGALEVKLLERGVAARRLLTMHAFHTPLMQPIAKAFAAEVRQVALNRPAIPYISNVTGTWITAGEATDPTYWVRHLCQPLRFADGLRALLTEQNQVLLEVGVGHNLNSLALQLAGREARQEPVTVASLPHTHDQRASETVLWSAVGQLWLAGVVLDWTAIYRDEPRRRVALPTYPFELQRYWIEPQSDAPVHAPQSAHTLPARPAMAGWLYMPVWKQSIKTARVDPPEAVQEPLHWLVFLDQCGVGRQIVERLKQAGHMVTTVVMGAAFGQSAEDQFVLDPGTRAGYAALVDALREALPQRVVHLWNLTVDEPALSGAAHFPGMQFIGYYSLIFLTQALVQAALTHSFTAWVVSNGVCSVGSDDLVCPEKVTLLGPCRTIPQEHQSLTYRHIDLVLASIESWQARLLIDQLMDELWQPADEPQVAYRGRARWVADYQPLDTKLTDSPPARLRQGGVYLLIDGLGNDSRIWAFYLARTLQARLVLLGRTGLPDRESWDNWLSEHPQDDPASIRIRMVRELEALGSQVLAIAADVTNEQQMRAALRLIDERFGVLHGVIHAAGITDVGSVCPVAELGTAESEQHFQPKIYGVYTLKRVLQGRTLDFVLLTSSILAITSGLGQCAYTSANIFMDAFAHQQSRTSPIPWTSLNWEGATPEETNEAFARLLSVEPLPQVVVSKEHLAARIKRRIKLDFLRQSSTPGLAGRTRPRLRTPYIAPTTPVEQVLVRIFQDVLGIEPIGIHDSFVELGGDSLLGLKVIAQARQAGLTISMQQMMRQPIVAALVANSAAEAVETDQPTVPDSGPAPLLPGQRWLLGVYDRCPAPQHWNMSQLIVVPANLNPQHLEQSIQQIVGYHDGLRAQFERDAAGVWRQTLAPPGRAVPLQRIDLTDRPMAERAAVLEQCADMIQRSLSITEGVLMRFALFTLALDQPQRLLVVMHHLLVDTVSLQIVLEDIIMVYQQLNQSQQPRLPPKTISFKVLGERLERRAQSEELASAIDQLQHWLEQEPLSALPLDYPAPRACNTHGAIDRVERSLGVAATQRLIQSFSQRHSTPLVTGLVLALLQTLTAWSGQRRAWITQVDSGRQILAEIEDLDVSRTVGWVSIGFDLILDRVEAATPAEALDCLKAQIQRLPERGLGHDLFGMSGRTAAIERLNAVLPDQVVINYFGRIDTNQPGSALFSPAPEAFGRQFNPDNYRPALFECFMAIHNDQLVLSWVYCTYLHQYATVERLADQFMGYLRWLSGLNAEVQASAPAYNERSHRYTDEARAAGLEPTTYGLEDMR